MKAPAFDYLRPGTLAEALEILRVHGEGAKLLAGGQSLMATLNMRLSAPKTLVDINRIEALAGIAVDKGVLRVGAMTRLADLGRSDLVARHAPLVEQAIPHIAHAAIRNRGTIGGSLCFADPAAELPACVAALGARLVLQSSRGSRTIGAAEFYRGLYQTELAPDELLVACEIPLAETEAQFGFAELARRHGDYAVVGIAAKAALAAGVFRDAKLVYFAAGDRPMIGHAATVALVGKPNTPATRQAAIEALGRDLDPPSDLNADGAMRLHLARVLTRRVLEGLAEPGPRG